MTQYDSKCSVVNIVDGDTLDLAIDPGFGITVTHRVRLLSIDAPEMHPHTGTETEREAEVQAAKAAKLTAEYWVAGQKSQLRVRTYKDPDSFGRYLGVVYAEGQAGTLNEYLVGQGFAVTYNGKPGEPRWRNTHLAEWIISKETA